MRVWEFVRECWAFTLLLNDSNAMVRHTSVLWEVFYFMNNLLAVSSMKIRKLTTVLHFKFGGLSQSELQTNYGVFGIGKMIEYCSYIRFPEVKRTSTSAVTGLWMCEFVKFPFSLSIFVLIIRMMFGRMVHIQHAKYQEKNVFGFFYSCICTNWVILNLCDLVCI